MKKNSFIFCLFIVIFNCNILEAKPKDTHPQNLGDWAEQQLAKMTLDEKIAQLLMIRIHSNFNEKYNSNIIDSIAKYQFGGVCFFQGGPMREAELTNRIQKISKIPLLVAIDGEWGVAMRLDSIEKFPRNMALGAICKNEKYITEMGKIMGKQCKALGIHLNFAPCIDINNNASNPVINSRSFGGDKYNVVHKAILLMKGMQAEGILTTAKHFPGHGDTDVDSHKDLPAILKTKQQIDSLELFPFKEMIRKGIDWIMVSHLWLPLIDTNANLPASLSHNIITNLLKKELGFKGIICTDAMDMRGLTKYATPGEAEVKALLAGIDVLVLPNQPYTVIQTIKKAIEDHILSEELINQKCLKILKQKQNIGLTKYKPIETNDLIEKINTDDTHQLIQNLTDETITILKNEQEIPIKNTDDSMAFVAIGLDSASIFQQKLSNIPNSKFYYLKKDADSVQRDRIINLLKPYSQIWISLHETTQEATNQYGIKPQTIIFLDSLTSKTPINLLIFGNAYILNMLHQIEAYKSIVLTYQSTIYTENATANVLLGNIKANGELPVETRYFPIGSAYHKDPLYQIQSIPAETSLLPKTTTQAIDSLVAYGIKERAFPGCQIIAVKDGYMIFRKNYGTLSYEDPTLVNSETIYDIASMTKTNATALAMMKLYEEHHYQLNDKLSNYLNFLKGTDKENITIEQILTHTSGLKPYIPFYLKYLNHNKTYKKGCFSKDSSNIYSIKIAENLYGKSDYKQEILNDIIHSKLGEKTYKYSDLGMILLKEFIEQETQTPFDIYVYENFYKPLNLIHTVFNAGYRYQLGRIAPTENDTIFRKQIICGTVHDPTAALLGGISGHAGLFSNAEDVAVIYQMLLNKGLYQNHRFFKPETVKLFTHLYHIEGNTRRGLCFDGTSSKKSEKLVPTMAGHRTFGHSGFTGTLVWADEKNQLIYVFISNRIYPDAEPSILLKLNLRGKIHEEIYKGLKIQ